MAVMPMRRRSSAYITSKANFLSPAVRHRSCPGALDFLQQVKARGITPVLVTGSGQHSLLDKLSHDYPGIFTPQTMVTAFDVKCGKPNPEPYLIGLKKAGVEPWQAIVVENAPLGVQAGVLPHRSIPLPSIRARWPDSALLDAGANLLLPDMGVAGLAISKPSVHN